MTPALQFVRTAMFSIVLVLTLSAELIAEDWPQWQGQNRDGVWQESGIVDAIPQSGLKVRWRTRIGRGYSVPVVANRTVIVTDQVFDPEVERVLCFGESTGEAVWTHSYPVD